MTANLSQSASHSSMLWLVKMIEVPDLRKEQLPDAEPRKTEKTSFKKLSTGNQPSDGIDGLPHLAPGSRVHSSGWLVQQHHLWPADESEGNIEFPLVASTILPARSVQILAQINKACQLFQLLVDLVLGASQASDSSKQGQHLSSS